ncbi:MAG: type II toxin-antitoxin system HicA family toxin [Ruminiclostridium sp.]|nr:type II toxin-antitoxin system HicA family toxin [Ruminiclostridium sp.]
MKLPRDMTGRQLTKLLANYGYEIVKQTGSHIKLTTKIKGEHHITIPEHTPLKVGTLNGILNDVSDHLGLKKDELAKAIFN